MKMMLSVAAGGALGALGRYYVVGYFVRWLGIGFPWGTLAVNVAGSLMLGVLVEVFSQFSVPGPEARGFLAVGLLGAFTTFSAFSADSVQLLERGQLMASAVYICATVILSIAAFGLGLLAVRQVAL